MRKMAEKGLKGKGHGSLLMQPGIDRIAARDRFPSPAPVEKAISPIIV